MPQRTLQQDADVRWQEFDPNDLLSQIRVHVYCAYRTTLGPAWRTAQTQDAKDRLYYVVSGSGEVVHHSRSYALQPGGLYLIPAHTPHSHSCTGRMDIYWCHFAAETRLGTPLFANLPVPYACHPLPEHGISSLFEAMARLYADDSPGAVFRRSGLLMQTLAPFIERADLLCWRQWHQCVQPFMPVIDLIDRRTGEPLLSSEELARAAHLSRCYFLSRFKQLFGVSPRQYQIKKRIELARVRLLQTADTVGHISTDLGFADAFHFSRQFRKCIGLSPRAFRAAHGAMPRL